MNKDNLQTTFAWSVQATPSESKGMPALLRDYEAHHCPLGPD